MSLLTDTDIKQILAQGPDSPDDTKLIIYPFNEASLTPVGYDLRVGTTYLSRKHGYKENLQEGIDVVRLAPGFTTNITTLEWVAMPKNKTISALICSKVNIVVQGLSHVSTSIDPDWQGRLLITLHNHSGQEVILPVGKTFCTVVFFRNASRATKTSNYPSDRADIMLKNMALTASNLERRRYREKWVLGTAMGVVCLVLAVTVYLLNSQYSAADAFDPAVAAGTLVASNLLAGLFGALMLSWLSK